MIVKKRKERKHEMKNQEMIDKLQELKEASIEESQEIFMEYLSLEPSIESDRRLINMINQKRHVIQLCEQLMSELYE